MNHIGSRDSAKGKSRHFERLTPREIQEIQGLVKNGLSLRDVTRKTGVSYSAVHKYAKRFSKRQTIVDFSVFERCELGYVVGFFVGDGSRIVDKKSGHYGAKLGFDARRDVEIASFLQRLFERAGKRVTLYSEGTWLVMKVYSKKFLMFLHDFVRYAECDGRVCKTLVGLKTWSRDFMLGFIGGLIDTDGYVQKNKRNQGHFGASITTANADMVDQLYVLFARLGVNTKICRAPAYNVAFSNRPTYYIRLSKIEFTKICSDMICIKHKQCGCNSKRLLE